MERILQNNKVSEIIPYDLDSPVLLFPVRHHSPVCSYHLEKTIEAYRPEIILIEGPENANNLIPVLAEENTILPAAFYYFYKDSKKLVSDEAEDYKCYYPFLYSSPEYRAVIKAKELDIPAEFIDLPYYEILINTSGNKGFRKKSDRHSYADDSDLIRSRFYKKLCEKTGLRDFEEFWEKYFEIGGLYLTTEKFVKQMHTYCILTRAGCSEEELKADGTEAREKFMTAKIRENMEKYSKILIVTGGFHSCGIFSLLDSEKIKPPKVHKIPENNHGCYPMAYSYEAADALHGYASGMSYPYFYDCISESLRNSDSPEGIYTANTLDLLARTAKETAKKDIPVSIADVTSAYTLMNGLAALRNSREAGMYETFDGVTSCFIKGEKTLSSSMPLEILARLATGNGVGKIGDKEHVPPLVADFEKQCEKLKLKYKTAVPNDIEVSMFSSAKGMESSRFMHRMQFLETGFSRILKGPDLHRNKDRSRVREEWRYRRTPNVDSALIDHTTDGFTIEEACKAYADKKLRNERRCEAAAQISVDCFLMGITMEKNQLVKIDEILSSDGDFFSLGKGLHSFDTLYSLKSLYGFEDKSTLGYLIRCFNKLISLLPSMANAPADRADDCIKIMRLLYGITGNILHDRQHDFEQALLTLTESPKKEPSVYGAAMGLLYAMDSGKRTDAQNAMQGYLRGSAEIKKQGADYLRGLFSTARDIVMTDDSFLRITDELITGMEYNDFLEILPSLKLAFSYFTPAEIQETAGAVANIHNTGSDNILKVRAVDEKLFIFGEEFDREIIEIMRKENI